MNNTVKYNTFLLIFVTPDQSNLIPTSLDVGNENNSKIVAPRFIWGTKQRRHSPNASFPLPSPLRMERGREGTLCVILLFLPFCYPTPKGVGYDKTVYFYYHNILNSIFIPALSIIILSHNRTFLSIRVAFVQDFGVKVQDKF